MYEAYIKRQTAGRHLPRVFQHAGNVSKRHPGMQAADVPLRGWLSAARVPHVEPPNIKENAKLLRSKTI